MAVMLITEKHKQAFMDLTNQLSPENLCCDGELPPAMVKARYRKLKAAWATLEKRAGFKVTEDDVYRWYRKRNN